MSAVTGTLGATLYVAAIALVDVFAAADNISDFQSLSYTQVGLVENLGQFGRKSELVTFVDISSARTLKIRGPYNDGQMQMTVGMDISDAGQSILFTAANTIDQLTYPFKIALVGTNAYFDTVYFGAKVFSFEVQAGAANSVLRALVSLEVNTQVYIGDA
jgi:hypothetical protein